MPEEAKFGDAAGAEAFVRYWAEALNYAYRTGDTEPVKEAPSLPGWESATSRSATWTSFTVRGARYEGVQ